MSGFEVAGLVLGIIPLIITGMEHYADGVTTLGRYRKYKLELAFLINGLETERAKLTNTCEWLLIGIAPPWEIDAMTKDPFGEEWRDEVILNNIHRRLYKDFSAFENTIKDVYGAVHEMKTRLAIQPDGTIKWVEGRELMRELKCATFSLRKSSYDDLMARIRDGISSLDKLAVANIELEPRRHIRSQSRLLKLVRDASWSIYRALRSSLTCRGTHDLSLQLAARSADFGPGDSDGKITSQLTFHVAVSNHNNAHVTSLSTSGRQATTWDEIVVQESRIMALPSPSPTPLPTPLSTVVGKKGKGKSVSFSWSLSAAVTDHTSTLTYFESPMVTNTTIPITAAAAAAATTAMAAIPRKSTSLNLCQMLCKAGTQPIRGFCGCVSDCEGPKTPREYSISLAANEDIAIGENCGHVIQSTISLQKVLENQSGNIPLPTFPDRIYLAVVISSSILQLHKTPWLPDILSSSDILFSQYNNRPLYRHAFVTKKNHTSATEHWPTNSPFVPCNPTVFSLAILLIELILGKSVRTLDANGQPDLLADHYMAHKYLNEVNQKGLENYESAVRQCINYHARKNSQDVEDESFRHDVYGNVVALLEQDLNIISNILY